MTNIARVEPKQELASSPAPAESPMGSALAFLQGGGNIEQLGQMMDLQARWEANEARKAFVRDMTEFKKHPPSIIKDRHVSFGTTSYDHASIGEVCEAIISAAAEHGFSHRWVPSQGESGQQVVTCVITHKMGHSEETRLEAPKDASGGKNAIQAIISSNTYLQRHSVLMAFGFATRDQPDDDGRAACGSVVETITDEQEIQINEMLEATDSDKAKFLKWCKIDRISDIPAKSFNSVMATLKAKEKAK